MKRKARSEFTLTIPSEQGKLQEVEMLAEKVAALMHFNSEERDSLAIAVTEAVNNAIIHGNRRDKRRKVCICFSLDKEQVTVHVRDEGQGFDPSLLRNPLEPENVLRENGRGIFILRALMDEVHFDFSEGGTEVIMVKKKRGR